MPKYEVKDARTGITLELEGDSPPTEAELSELFKKYDTTDRAWGERLRGAASGVKDTVTGMVPALAGMAQRYMDPRKTALETIFTVRDDINESMAEGVRRGAAGVSMGQEVERMAGVKPDESEYRRQGRLGATAAVYALPFLPKAVRGGFRAYKARAGATPIASPAPNVRPPVPPPEPVVSRGFAEPPIGAKAPTPVPRIVEPPAIRSTTPKPAPELPEAWKALMQDTPPVRSTKPIDLDATLGKVTERAPEIPKGAKVRDELYRSVLQEHMPGGRVTGVTAKGEAAVRQALEDAGFDKARRSQFYREAEGARANYRRLLDDEKGAISPKLLVPVGGAGLGAAIGGATGDEDDDQLGRALLGALMGGTAGVVATNPKGALTLANKARIEGMLSGLAIPKNIATATGAALTAAAESGSLAPIKEMARVPTNLRVFAQAVKNPNATARGTGLASHTRTPGPVGRVIGGIDETAKEFLRRAGVTEAERDRLLLTADNNAGQALGLDNPVGRFVVPFQRTPANALREGVTEMNQALGGAPGRYNAALPNVNPKVRRTLTATSPILGAIIGEWAAEDPKHRGPIAAVLLAAAGPRTLPATMGALGWAGARHGSGLARGGGLGGLAPIPEMSFDPKAMTGWPPSLVRLIKRYTEDAK